MELSTRAAYRGQVTKIVRSAMEYLAAQDSQLNSDNNLELIEEELQVLLQRLTAAHESLSVMNKEVSNKGLFKADELDKETEKVAEYQDMAIDALARINSRLQRVRRKQAPPSEVLDNPNSSRLSNRNDACPPKLPKLPLKRFDGNIQEWLPFWEQFKTAVHENVALSSSDKFCYLESVLTGKAKRVIGGFTASGTCYEAAISLLREQFGDPERLVDKHMQQLVSLRPVQTRTDAAGLRTLYNAVTSCCRTLTALQIPTHQYHVMLKSILIRCLPVDLRVDYFRSTENDDNQTMQENETSITADDSTSTILQVGDKHVETIMRFLKREVESLERSEITSNSSANVKRISSDITTATNLMSLHDRDNCIFCGSDQHATKECDSKLSVEQKKEVLRKENRCYRCAKRGHSSKKCRTAKYLSCAKCKGKHFTSLCDPKGEIVLQSASVCACDLSHKSNVFLKTGRGIIAAPIKSNQLLIRFLIDGGSQCSYIREDLVKKLKIPTIGQVNLSLMPFGSTNQTPSKLFNKVNIVLQSQYCNQSVDIDAIVVPNICVDVLPPPDISSASIQSLQMADVHHADIDAAEGLSLLIGSDKYWSVVTGKQRFISPSMRAVQTIFGWTLQGKQSLGKNLFLNEISSSPPNCSAALCLSSLESDCETFWSLETIGIRQEEVENQLLADDLIAQCITRKEHRYEAVLPWKNPDAALRSNRDQALKRLRSLTMRLSKNPALLQDYDSAIQRMMSDGFAEPISSAIDGQQKRVFYLPHHPVFKTDSTTTKMRIVFDASARNQDSLSLNDMLQVGANLLPDVLKVVLNFRLGRYGVVADVEKAFLQIMLNNNDRDTHRFVWFAPGALPRRMNEFMDYRMTRVTFGVNCSPFLLTATIREHLKQEEANFPSTCPRLQRSFYMDDVAMALDTEDDAIRVSQEAVKIMSKASMNLRKWNSNSSHVREVLGSGYAAVNQKVLGLNWFVLGDEIGVATNSMEESLRGGGANKRIVLSTIARVFDPLGMLSPVIVKVKVLFQSIWKAKLSWDEPLTGHLLAEWEQCVKGLSHLSEVTIPRAALSFGASNTKEVHIFADASLKAFGAVAYITSVDSSGEKTSSFLCAKSRVAPLKDNGLTLPQLELTAAVIAARLCAYLKRSLETSICGFYLWTDSKITLNRIQGEKNKWKPYVQSRVEEIRKHTKVSEWRHCSGKENLADLVTRGISADALQSSSLWKEGPSWLKSGDFPVQCSGQMDSTTLIVETATGDEYGSSLSPLLPHEKVGTWKHLVRVTAYIQRFVNACRTKDRATSIHLSAEEVTAAEIYWIRYTQSICFTKEFRSLQEGKPIPKISKIVELLPFLDDKLLLRVKGRLQYLDDSSDIRHPIILPTESHVTNLIIDDYHQRTLHGGTNIVLSQLRTRFWIPKGRQCIQKRIKTCVICRKLFGKPSSAPFGPLPVDRLKLLRPFDIIGVDFAGPLYSFDESDSRSKVYMMVFTCAAVRAVHLEMLPSLSTDSCLTGLKRFIARRGIPSIIYSDNAKTFRRAAFELKGVGFSDGALQDFLAHKCIKWKFSVERAPWWGGFWERLIRTIKNVLKVIIGKAKLTSEHLRTLLIETEGVVNSRPLTYVGSNLLDAEPLTPAHFLGTQYGPTTLHDISEDVNGIRSFWTRRQKYTNKLWKRWRMEYLQLLRSFHHNKVCVSSTFKRGDVVLVADSGKPRLDWKLATIEEVFPGRDGYTRACEIRYSNGFRTRRPIQLLYNLEIPAFSPPGGC